jgi:iron complex transport system ATP-binding protein
VSLVLADVCVRYGRSVAVDAVTLEAKPGEILALVGPNGSGKSSLLKAAAGLLRHDGRIVAPRARDGSRLIGYMPQDTGSQAALTVLETVLIGRHQRLGLSLKDQDLRAAHAALDQLGVADLAGRSLGELSGGQRQLVFLAQALADEPSVLLLDEPISALDIHHQLQVLETVRRLTVERGLATIVVLHDLTAAARHADRIAVLRCGRLLACGLASEALTLDLIRQAFGIEAAIVTAPDGKPVIVALHCADAGVSDSPRDRR